MRKLIVSLLFSASLSICSAEANVSSNSEYFSVLCKIDHGVGFNWNINQWIPTNFVPRTYVISKLDPTKHENECLVFIVEKETGTILYPSRKNPELGVSKGCYMLKTLGEDAPLFGQNCSETWVGPKDKNILRNIECGQAAPGSYLSFEFRVNGEIVLTNMGSPFDLNSSPDNGRDSIFLEIGKCSQLS